MTFDWKNTNKITFWESKRAVESFAGVIDSSAPVKLGGYLPGKNIATNEWLISRNVEQSSSTGQDIIKLKGYDKTHWKRALMFFDAMEFVCCPNKTGDSSKGSHLRAMNLNQLASLEIEGCRAIYWVVCAQPTEDLTKYSFVSKQVWQQINNKGLITLHSAAYEWPPQ